MPALLAVVAVLAVVGVVVWWATRRDDPAPPTPHGAGGIDRPDAPGARSEASRTDSERLSDRSA